MMEWEHTILLNQCKQLLALWVLPYIELCWCHTIHSISLQWTGPAGNLFLLIVSFAHTFVAHV